MKIDERKQNGVVYTPKWIVETILDNVDYKKDIVNKTVVDPACGDGAFLSEVVKRFILDAEQMSLSKLETKKSLEKSIFGFDIDEIAIKKCITILDEVAKNHDLRNIRWQIAKTDSLNRDFVSKYFGVFDFVVGNPPYIRVQHLGEERRTRIQAEWRLCEKGSTDIFIAFFELGFNLLNRTGKLGYITPNTYLKTKAGESLRRFIRGNNCLKILIDFEHNQLFDNATTYSVITVLGKDYKKKTFSLFKGDAESINYIDEVSTENLNESNWILTSNDILKKLIAIEKRGLPLSRIARIHVGVTTLADDFYIFKDLQLDKNFANVKLKDGRSFWIERSILKPIVKVSVLKDPNENQNRFIIFPYQKVNDKHVVIPEGELKNKFPLTYKYFLAIKANLDSRDKGKPNPVAWYAYGRSQGLDTSFGKKILTSPINLKPNFIVWEREDFTFYAGYCIKFDGNLRLLAQYLNSKDMEFYINHTSRNYQNNYKSFSKSFISNFGVADLGLFKAVKQQQLSWD